jgi:queuine tRNA-ribosyltransferase
LDLMREMREAISEGRFQLFVSQFHVDRARGS